MKTKSTKRLCGLVLAIATCFSLAIAASAADVEYPGDPSTRTVNGYTYTGWSTLYVGSGYRAGTFVQTANHQMAPAGYIQYQARLFSADGAQLTATDTLTNRTATDLVATTTRAWPTHNAYSRGWVAYKNANGHYEAYDLPKTTTIMTRSANEIDYDTLMKTLTDNEQYPVNKNGETYGSALLSDVVGEEPDLIASIGVDGVKGYVRQDELHTEHHVPANEEFPIPLYDVDGNVIGSFMLTGVDLEASEALANVIRQNQK